VFDGQYPILIVSKHIGMASIKLKFRLPLLDLLKMGAIGCPETSVSNRYYYPEERSCHRVYYYNVV